MSLKIDRFLIFYMNYHLELVIKKINTTNINDFKLNISSHYINTTQQMVHTQKLTLKQIIIYSYTI